MNPSQTIPTHQLPPPPPPKTSPASEPAAAPERVIRLDEGDPGKGLGPDFTKLWLATAASNIGDGVRIAALPLLAALITRDPLLISGVVVATRLPWLLFSLHAGAITDRIDRKRLVVRVNLARAVVMGLLALSVLTGTGGLAALYIAALLQGIGEVFSDNASFALLPQVVRKDRLEKANGRLEVAIIVANEFGGPALGALLFAAWASVPFALDAATFVAAAWLLSSMKVSSAPREEPSTSIRSDIAEGLRWLRGHRVLRSLTGIAALTNLALQATFAIQVLFVLGPLGLSPAAFGLLLAAEAAGSIAGSFLAAPMKNRLGTRTTVVIALGITAAANLAIAVTGAWIVAGAMWIAITAAGAVWSILTNSLRQSLVPDELMGRIQSAHRLFSWGAMPLGAALGGVVASVFGLRAPFVTAGALLVLLTVAAGALLKELAPVAVHLPEGDASSDEEQTIIDLERDDSPIVL